MNHFTRGRPEPGPFKYHGRTPKSRIGTVTCDHPMRPSDTPSLSTGIALTLRATERTVLRSFIPF